MDFKTGLILVVLAVGCAALPTQQDDMSIFFDHVNPSARIVGGVEAPDGAHPHMVLPCLDQWSLDPQLSLWRLAADLPHRADGCTLYRPGVQRGFSKQVKTATSSAAARTVLTAAHCILAVFSEGLLSSNLRLTVGTNRWNAGGQTYAVERNVTHQHWVRDVIKNDVGLLITIADVVMSSLVQAVPLSFEFAEGDVPVKVAGWGRIRAGGSLSTTLLELSTSTISGQQCVADAASASVELKIDAPPVDPLLELCTYHSAGRGNCNGDSGSALIRTDVRAQVGVVSWGFPCALGAPDMFARVSAYRDWIQENVV